MSDPKQYVALKRIHYRAFVGDGSDRYIDPHPEDPQQGERFTVEHLPEPSVKLLIAKKIIAPAEEQQPAAEQPAAKSKTSGRKSKKE